MVNYHFHFLLQEMIVIKLGNKLIASQPHTFN